VIMRTSITVYDDLTAQYWEEMNRYSVLWAKKQQSIISPEELSLFWELERSIPLSVRKTYFEARSRNHSVNLRALQLLHEDVLDILSFTQEDAHPFGPHQLEQSNLKRRIETSHANRVFIYPGADEGGLILLAKALQEAYQCSVWSITTFFPKTSRDHIAKFEDIPLAENVSRQIRAGGFAKANGPQLWTAVLGPERSVQGLNVWQKPDNSGSLNLDYEKLWAGIEMAYTSGLYPTIADVIQPNGAEIQLFDFLRGRDLTKIASYAGWNTAGNTIGTALALGAVVAVAQHRGIYCEAAHREFFIERILDDYVYQRIVREELAEYILKNPSWGNRHQLTSVGWKELNQIVQAKMQHWANSNLTDYNLPPAQVTAHLPWPRIFEVSVTANLERGLR